MTGLQTVRMKLTSWTVQQEEKKHVWWMSLTAHRVDVFQRAGNVTDSPIVRMDQMNQTLVLSPPAGQIDSGVLMAAVSRSPGSVMETMIVGIILMKIRVSHAHLLPLNAPIISGNVQGIPECV